MLIVFGFLSKLTHITGEYLNTSFVEIFNYDLNSKFLTFEWANWDRWPIDRHTWQLFLERPKNQNTLHHYLFIPTCNIIGVPLPSNILNGIYVFGFVHFRPLCRLSLEWIIRGAVRNCTIIRSLLYVINILGVCLSSRKWISKLHKKGETPVFCLHICVKHDLI